MKRRRTLRTAPILVISDDRNWLEPGRSAFAGQPIVTRHVRTGEAPLRQLDPDVAPAVAVFNFRSLANPEFRVALRFVQAHWPGVPTVACTVMAIENLVHLNDIIISTVLDIFTPWPRLVATVNQLANSIDMSAVSSWLEASPRLARSLAAALAYALAADPPVMTLKGLARRTGIALSTLRSDYKPIADRSGISLPSVLHAIVLARVAVHCARGESLSVACTEVGIDQRTANSLTLRVSGTQLSEVVSSVATYREWLENRILRVVVRAAAQ